MRISPLLALPFLLASDAVAQSFRTLPQSKTVELPASQVLFARLTSDGTRVAGHFEVPLGTPARPGLYDFVTDTYTWLPPGLLSHVSADGALATGGARPPGSTVEYLAHFDGATWNVVSPLVLYGACNLSGVGTGISDDGTRVVGGARNFGCQNAVGYWDPFVSATPTPLPPPAGVVGADMEVGAISGDGQVIGGARRLNLLEGQALLWTWDATLGAFGAPQAILEGIDFGDGDLRGLGRVLELSVDGSVAAIRRDQGPGARVVLRRADGTVLPLESEPGQVQIAQVPYGISRRGNLVVGNAFVWSEALGLQTPRAFLEAYGVDVPAGLSLGSVIDVSDDGRVLLGLAPDGLSTLAWVAELPAWAPYGSSSITLDAAGSTSIAGGAVLDLNLANLPHGLLPEGGLFTTAISAAPAQVASSIGPLLVDLGGPNLAGLVPGVWLAGPTAVQALPVPPAPNLAGREFFLQTAVLPLFSQSWVLTNGLRVRLSL